MLDYLNKLDISGAGNDFSCTKVVNFTGRKLLIGCINSHIEVNLVCFYYWAI